MANRKPVTVINGNLQEIASPDVIDPSILPASGSFPITIASGSSFDVAVGVDYVVGSPETLDGILTVEGSVTFL